jgi:ElaB/YqjD/DUF883 family membrane-anchored ribosome-binding protein
VRGKSRERKRIWRVSYVSAEEDLYHARRSIKETQRNRRSKLNPKENIMTEENKTTIGAGAIPAAAQEKLKSTKTQVRAAADDLKSAAGAMAEEYRGKAEQMWGDARDRARTFQKDSEQYVRENPTRAVFAALGIGVVLGLIFRRRAG